MLSKQNSGSKSEHTTSEAERNMRRPGFCSLVFHPSSSHDICDCLSKPPSEDVTKFLTIRACVSSQGQRGLAKGTRVRSE